LNREGVEENQTKKSDHHLLCSTNWVQPARQVNDELLSTVVCKSATARKRRTPAQLPMGEMEKEKQSSRTLGEKQL
jgi:hypothetical protein